MRLFQPVETLVLFNLMLEEMADHLVSAEIAAAPQGEQFVQGIGGGAVGQGVSGWLG